MGTVLIHLPPSKGCTVSNQIRLVYDDDQLNVIDAVNKALRPYGLKFIDDCQDHDGFTLLTLQTIPIPFDEMLATALTVLEARCDGNELAEQALARVRTALVHLSQKEIVS